MSREDQIINERLRKVKELKEQGIDPYPHKFNKKHTAAEALKSKLGAKVITAGRIMTKRDIGKIIFANLRDHTGDIQIVFQEGETPEKVKDLFKKYVDAGDFVGVEGKVFKTKTKQISILVDKLTILSKSILPLPEKFHGLQDKEERYRKRYLDLVMNPEVRQVFEKRTKILKAIREFMDSKEFEEVDTPYLQSVYGGASARPFKTHLNALDINLFLSISPELYLKRLIVGGYDRVYTIARNFRNEGVDRWHNPEFTMMEVYTSYWDYNDMMELVEDLFVYVAKKVNGSTKITFRGKEVDFKKPWKRMTMADAIKKYAGIDVLKMSEKELKTYVEKNNIEKKGESWGWYMQSIFEHFCEEKLEQPIFITDHPLETTPLCKLHRNDKTGRLIERFEPFCMGAELANAYSELNDPVLQRKLLEEQAKMLAKGNEEANPYDEDFVNALEIGMPPTGGLGIGIDRMIMLLTGQESIRDVLLFPFMKPEEKSSGEKTQLKSAIKEDIKWGLHKNKEK